MSESSSSDIGNKLKHIKQIDAELSISTDQSINVDDSNIITKTNTNSNKISSLNKNSETNLDDGEDSISNNNSDTSFVFQENSEKISKFCANFNKKVGVSTNSLEEVLEIVDVLVSNHASDPNSLEFFKISGDSDSIIQKLKNRIAKLKAKNKELQIQLNQNEIQNSNLQADVDQLKYQNNRLEETLNDMQIRLQSSQQEIKDLNDRSSRNKNSRDVLESTVSNLGDLIQSQLDDSANIISQRDSLLKIINKQNSALQQYEQIFAKMNEENNKNSESSILSKTTKSSSLTSNFYDNPNCYEDSNYSKDDTFPMILSIVSKSSEELNADIRLHISDIINDSSIPLIERIENVISYVCHEANEAIQFSEETKEKIKQLKSDNSDIQHKCIEILSLFDEEMQFLQRLAHSKEIQSCIFFREDQNDVIPFDKESKEELIKHCARVSRYIEETIPQLNIDEMNDAFSQFESIQPTEIFNLLNANVLEQKMRDFYSRLKNFNVSENQEKLSQDSETNEKLIDIQLKELLCLFAAQAFTNDILQNHSVELRMRYEITQREIQQLRLDIEENKEPLKSMKKVINHFAKRENKVKRILTKILDHYNKKKKVDSKSEQADSNSSENDQNEDDLLSIVKEIVILINQNRIGQAEKLEHELQQVIDEKTQIVEELNDHVQKIEAELSKAEKVYKESCNQLNETIETVNNNLENEKEKNSELTQKVEDLQNQLKEVTETYNQLRSNRQDEIKGIQEESDNQIQSLASQLELKTKRVNELEAQINSLQTKIDELKKEKKEAKERIEYLETVNIKSVNSLKEKSKNLRKQCEESIVQIQNQLQTTKEDYRMAQDEVRELQAKNEELAVELSNCQINKKAVELRLKALEDRFESTKQTMSSQHDAKLKSLTTQIEEKLKKINDEQKLLINGFIQYANENLDAHFDIDIENELDVDLGFDVPQKNSDLNYDDSILKRFLRYLQGELEARHHAQVVYEETAADVLKVQKLLKISECQDLYGPVSSLVKMNKELSERIKKCQDEQIESEKRSSDYCREMRKVESQIASLRQWESWARRVHRIVHETCCTTYSSDQLRLSLEESILSSVSQKTLLAKLHSLREQKKAITMLFNNYISSHNDSIQGGNESSNLDQNLIFNELRFHGPPTEKMRPTWTSILAICAFIRRMQKLSGFIPIDYQPSSASSLAISCGVVESSQKKKKKKSRTDSNTQTFSMFKEMSEVPQKKPSALFKNI